MTGGGLLPVMAVVSISRLMVVSISPDDGGEPLAGWGVSERLTTGGQADR